MTTTMMISSFPDEDAEIILADFSLSREVLAVEVSAVVALEEAPVAVALVVALAEAVDPVGDFNL